VLYLILTTKTTEQPHRKKTIMPKAPTKPTSNNSSNTHHATDANIERRQFHKSVNFFKKQFANAQVEYYDVDFCELLDSQSDHPISRPSGYEEQVLKNILRTIELQFITIKMGFH
jgi:hypothetical protein